MTTADPAGHDIAAGDQYQQIAPVDVVQLTAMANAFFQALPTTEVTQPVPAYSRPDTSSLGVPKDLPLTLIRPGTLEAPADAGTPDPVTSLDHVDGGRWPSSAAELGLPTDLTSLAATNAGNDPAATPALIANPVTLQPAAGVPDPGSPGAVGSAGGAVPNASGATLAELAAIAVELSDLLGLVTGVPEADTAVVAPGLPQPAPHASASGVVPAAIPGTPALGDLPIELAEPAAPTAVGLPADTPTASLSIFEFHPQMLPSLAGTAVTARPFDPYAIRRDFPILSERVHGRPLIWLDNGATTHKPQQVIDRISYYYAHENSNIHRAAHTLAARSTDAYEGAREKVRRFLNAAATSEIVFVRGATEGVNLVANTWGQANVGQGDEILITHLEHHANIVPWQQLAQRTGAVLKVAPVDDSGQVILTEFNRLISPRTKIAAMTQVSNALGTITPVAEMIEIAHRRGVVTLVDAAQSVLHMRVDVAALDADFLVFSGHKMFAPTGIGAVYGKAALWANTPPWQGGGNMIADVTFERTVYQPPPNRFEAGTGNIADAVGLGAAVDYLSAIGLENVTAYEHELLEYATAGLLSIPGLRLIGTAAQKAAVLSFVLEGHEPLAVGAALDQEGIAVRAGHHCAQPILRRFGVEATVRPSLAMYNIKEEIDCLVAAVRRIQAGGPARI